MTSVFLAKIDPSRRRFRCDGSSVKSGRRQTPFGFVTRQHVRPYLPGRLQLHRPHWACRRGKRRRLSARVRRGQRADWRKLIFRVGFATRCRALQLANGKTCWRQRPRKLRSIPNSPRSARRVHIPDHVPGVPLPRFSRDPRDTSSPCPAQQIRLIRYSRIGPDDHGDARFVCWHHLMETAAEGGPVV